MDLSNDVYKVTGDISHKSFAIKQGECMSFDELKAKWQSHDHGMQLTIDPGLLLNEVRRNHRAFELQLWKRDVNEVLASALITIVFAVLGVLLREWSLFLCAVGSLFVGLFFVFDRLKQRRLRSAASENSLQSTIDASLADLQHQIWLLKNVFWWYLLPLLPGITLFLISTSWQSRSGELAEQLVIVGVAGICAIAFWYVHRINQREVIRTLEPRRIELEALRASLSSIAANT